MLWVGFAAVVYRPAGVSPAGIGCPVKHLTGLDCPGCGSTRSLGALVRLDLHSALDHHLLVPAALVFVVWSWAAWARSSWTGRPLRPIVSGPGAILAIAAVLIVFTVVRNLEVGSWLASGLSTS